MPPLKNLRHEKFAQATLESNTTKDAYIKAYPLSNPGSKTPIVNGCRLLSKVEIRNRIIELMQANPSLSPSGLTTKLASLVDSQNEGVSLNAVSLALKSLGMFNEDKQSLTVDTINVTFGDISQHNTGISGDPGNWLESLESDGEVPTNIDSDKTQVKASQ